MVNVNGTETLIPPPEGYVVDFENPKQQFVIRSYTVASVEMFLAFLFLLQRLYTKVVIMKAFQLEDGKSSNNFEMRQVTKRPAVFVIIAWAFCMGTQVCLLLGMGHGAIGRHAWEISIDKYGYYSRVRYQILFPSQRGRSTDTGDRSF